MANCTNNSQNINKTFIVTPIADVFSACTAVYTNFIESCSGNTNISLTSGVTIFNESIEIENNVDVRGCLFNTTGDLKLDDNVIITGNLTVLGTATTIHTEILQVEDNNIVLNLSGTHLTALGGGITIEDGQSSGVSSTILIDSNGCWTFAPAICDVNISGITTFNGPIAIPTGTTVAITGGTIDLCDLEEVNINEIISCQDYLEVNSATRTWKGGEFSGLTPSGVSQPVLEVLGDIYACGTNPDGDPRTLWISNIHACSPLRLNDVLIVDNGHSGTLDEIIFGDHPISAASVTVLSNFIVSGGNTTLLGEFETSDNNLTLNLSGTHLTAIGGGITVLDGQADGVDSTIKTDTNGDWVFEPALNITAATVADLTANTVTTNVISATTGIITSLTSTTINVTDLTANTVTSNIISASTATIDEITATTINVEDIEITGDLSACTGTVYISNVDSCDSGDTVTFNIDVDITGDLNISGDTVLTNLTGNTISATTIDVDNGTIDSLTSTTINSIDIITSSLTATSINVTDIEISGDLSACTGTIFIKTVDSCDSGDTITFNANIDVNESILSGGTDLITIIDDRDNYTSGGTLFGDTIYFNTLDTLSAYTVDLSALEVNDTFISGATFVNNELTLTRNDGAEISLFVNELTGLTVNGNVDVNGTLSAVTVDADTILSGGTDLITIIDSRDNYVSGSTLIGDTAYFNTLDSLSAFTLDLSALEVNDTFITGSTYNSATNTVTLTRNDNVTFDFYIDALSGLTVNGNLDVNGTMSAVTSDADTILSGGTNLLTIIDSRDNYATGATLFGDTVYVNTIDSLSAFTIDLSALEVNDTFFTGVTFVNNELTLTRNDGFSNSIFINELTGLTVNGNVDVNGTLSAVTVDADTLLSGGTDLLTIIDGRDNYTSGATLIGDTAYFDTLDTLSAYTLDLSALEVNDTFITGTSYNSATNTVTLTRNDGSTFDAYIDAVSGLTVTGILDVQTSILNTTGTLLLDDSIEVTGDALVHGNVTILGTATTINTQTLTIEDNIITLNSNVTGATAPILDAGLEVLRGSADTAVLLWDESEDEWVVGTTGNTSPIITEATFPDFDIFVSAGTFSNVTDTITLERSNGANITITGLTDEFTTGATLIGSTVYFDRTDGLSAYTLDISALEVNDTFVTGFTYNGSNVVTIKRNEGEVDLSILIDTMSGLTINGNLTVTGDTTMEGVTANTIDASTILSGGTDLMSLIDSRDNFTSGATLIGDMAYFDTLDSLSAYTLDLGGLSAVLSADTFFTDLSFSNNEITITRNDAFTDSIFIDELTGLTINGDLTVTGNTILENLTANTVNLTTLISGGTDLITIIDDRDNFTTGATLIGDTAYFNTLDSLSAFTLDLSALEVNDTFISAATYNSTTNTITIDRNDGVSFDAYIDAVSGLTVNGTLSATTIDGNTLLSGGTDLLNIFATTGVTADLRTDLDTLSGQVQTIDGELISGGTFSNATDTITLNQNNGGTITISGITDEFTTGATLFGSTVYFDRTDGLSAYTVDLSALEVNDTFVTGFTYDGNNVFTITRNEGEADLSVTLNTLSGLTINGELTVTGDTNIGGTLTADTVDANTILSGGTDLLTILDNRDNYATGATLFGTTLYVDTIDSLSAFTADLSALQDDTNFYATGATLIGDTVYVDRNDTLSAFTIDLSTLDVNDTFLTGSTFINNELTLTRNDGTSISLFINELTGLTVNGNVDVTGTLSGGTLDGDTILSGGTDLLTIIDGRDNYTTGTTLVETTLYFNTLDSLSAYTADLSSFIDDTNTFFTGATFIDNELTITRNDGFSDSIFINELTGLTINGNLDVNGTMSATTVDGNDILSGGTNLLNIFSQTDFFATGATLVGTTLYVDRNDVLSAFTADLSALQDDTNFYATGATLIGDTAYFDRNDSLSAFTLDLSALADNDTFVTGSTITGGTSLVLTRNDGVNIVQDLGSITGDTFATGATLSTGGTLTITRNDDVDISVTGFSTSDQIITPDSILDIYQSGITNSATSMTYVDVDWDAEALVGDDYSFTANNATIEVLETGYYEIVYSLSLNRTDNGGGQGNSRARIALDDGGGFSEISRSGAWGFHRSNVRGECTLTKNIKQLFNSGDKIKLQFNIDNGEVATIIGDSNITMTKLAI